ncbi:MAG: AAA family ATPase, partial [bacterium]|nr:AAA family ATPase [bacterium]
GKYFTINRPRQYGKTTVLFQVEKELAKMDYLVISLNFQEVGESMFSSEKMFTTTFLKRLRQTLKRMDNPIVDSLLPGETIPTTFDDLSDAITQMVKTSEKEIVLQIDEIDSSMNNQEFLRFLGMLRAKYLAGGRGQDSTFHSVILAGVHDIKNLKIKIRPEDDHQVNSPWNIAIDFKVDLNLSPDQISEMLTKYVDERSVSID